MDGFGQEVVPVKSCVESACKKREKSDSEQINMGIARKTEGIRDPVNCNFSRPEFY
jgi:NAD(P)H-nitrite reductase large subunit